MQPILLAREAQAVLRNEPAEAFVHLREAGTTGGNFPKATVALLPNGSMLCGGMWQEPYPLTRAHGSAFSSWTLKTIRLGQAPTDA